MQEFPPQSAHCRQSSHDGHQLRQTRKPQLALGEARIEDIKLDHNRVMTFQQYSLVSSICIRTRRPARSSSRCWRSTFCRAPIATWDVRGWSCGGSW